MTYSDVKPGDILGYDSWDLAFMVISVKIDDCTPGRSRMVRMLCQRLWCKRTWGVPDRLHQFIEHVDSSIDYCSGRGVIRNGLTIVEPC